MDTTLFEPHAQLSSFMCLFVCCYLCSSSVEGLFLPGNAVLNHLLSDQPEPLLNLLQLSSHLLWQRCRILSLEDDRDILNSLIIYNPLYCFVFSGTACHFGIIYSLNLWLVVSERCVTLRLFMSKACVRSANSLSAVLMVPCRRRSFSSSFLVIIDFPKGKLLC